METKNREKLLFMATGIGVGLLLLNLLVIDPLIATWHTREDRIAALKKQISEGELVQSHAPSINHRWGMMKTNALSSDTTVAENQMFKSFDGFATQSGVTVLDQRPQQKDSDDESYSNMEWHTDVRGTLDQIVRYLYCLESSPMGMKVDSIELTASDDVGRQFALGLTVSGLILNSSTNSPE